MMITKANESYTVEEILPLIGSEKICGEPGKKWLTRREVIGGDEVKTGSIRLQTFKNSCVCVNCGAAGTVFLKQRNFTNQTWHLNLFAEVDGELVLMTKDHIKPKSRGGNDGLDNMQTMCTTCNLEKGNMTEIEWGKHKDLVKALVLIKTIKDFGAANPGRGYTCSNLAKEFLKNFEENA